MNPLGTNTSIYASSVPLLVSAEKDAAGSAGSGLGNIESENTVFSPVDEPDNNLPVANRDEKSAEASEASSSVDEKAIDLQHQNDRRVIGKLGICIESIA